MYVLGYGMGGRATANLARSGQEVRHRTTDTRLGFFLPTTYPCLLKINFSILTIHAAILAIEIKLKLRLNIEGGVGCFRSMRFFSPIRSKPTVAGHTPFRASVGFFYLDNTHESTLFPELDDNPTPHVHFHALVKPGGNQSGK